VGRMAMQRRPGVETPGDYRVVPLGRRNCLDNSGLRKIASGLCEKLNGNLVR